MSPRRKWPIDATEEFKIRATEEQALRWYAGLREAGHCHKEIEPWIAGAATFFAWWLKRQRELFEEAEARLQAEARVRAMEQPCEET